MFKTFNHISIINHKLTVIKYIIRNINKEKITFIVFKNKIEKLKKIVKKAIEKVKSHVEELTYYTEDETEKEESTEIE